MALVRYPGLKTFLKRYNKGAVKIVMHLIDVLKLHSLPDQLARIALGLTFEVS